MCQEKWSANLLSPSGHNMRGAIFFSEKCRCIFWLSKLLDLRLEKIEMLIPWERLNSNDHPLDLYSMVIHALMCSLSSRQLWLDTRLHGYKLLIDSQATTIKWTPTACASTFFCIMMWVKNISSLHGWELVTYNFKQRFFFFSDCCLYPKWNQKSALIY